MQNDETKPANPVLDLVDGRLGEDLQSLARDLGYSWPDDLDSQWRVLKTMASRASYWRKEFQAQDDKEFAKVYRETMYQHQQKRYLSAVAKLKNTRKALRQFMASQSAFVREGLARLESSSR